MSRRHRGRSRAASAAVILLLFSCSPSRAETAGASQRPGSVQVGSERDAENSADTPAVHDSGNGGRVFFATYAIVPLPCVASGHRVVCARLESQAAVTEPIRFELPARVASLAAVRGGGCASLESGSLYCWGCYDSPRYPPDAECHRNLPRRVPIEPVAQVTPTGVLLVDGAVRLWNVREREWSPRLAIPAVRQILDTFPVVVVTDDSRVIVAKTGAELRLLGVPDLEGARFFGWGNDVCVIQYSGKVFCGEMARDPARVTHIQFREVGVPPAADLLPRFCSVSLDTRDLWCWSETLSLLGGGGQGAPKRVFQGVVNAQVLSGRCLCAQAADGHWRCSQGSACRDLERFYGEGNVVYDGGSSD